ncbi:hypothetical protein DV711_03265 [Motiliproteus coralliicola]|uniref:Uncharacterized protein n=1 Tax=Motiliproteus coralliicola TaxID=2283196 RepID=A0A369WSS3_9GAMM|nr:hypothetical protein [Motiliproteus coralliicola]RDE24621.1 hypothetical protein DV711_03265 [Motiliproteus coralliicola]
MSPLIPPILQRLPAFIVAILILVFLLLSSGCIASNPLRIPDEEWSQLSREQQLQAYQDQAELDKVRIQARAEEKQAAREAEARIKEQQLMLRRHARYGDLVQCVLEPVQVNYSSKWKTAAPVAFDLVRGETRELSLRDEKGRYRRTGWVSFDEAGQEVALCRQSSGYSSNGCDRLLGTTKEFHRGIQGSIDIERFVRANLRCDLKPTH